MKFLLRTTSGYLEARIARVWSAINNINGINSGSGSGSNSSGSL
jgi:hypothetical protein